MPEELRKADVLLRAVSKIIDVLLIASVSELLPKAGFLSGVFYILISDGLLEGRSIGKKIIGLQVISLASQAPCSIKDSILRNLPLALAVLALKIPIAGIFVCAGIVLIELVLVVGSSDGMRGGDILAGTSVVVRDGKDKEEAKGFA